MITSSPVLLIGSNGYIGSYLYHKLREERFDVDDCDQTAPALYPCRYQNLEKEDLRHYPVVFWFAGHSSVKQAEEDPDGAQANNCDDVIALRQRMPENSLLVYASSASVYSLPTYMASSAKPPLSQETDVLRSPINVYDRSKLLLDLISRVTLKNTLGLRLGTVCGWNGEATRRDTVFNAMNLSALNDGEVRLSNPNAWRSLLFLDDLLTIVRDILRGYHASRRVMNAASVNIKMESLALSIAAAHNAKVVRLPDTPTYSFRMAGVQSEPSILSECKRFARDMQR